MRGFACGLLVLAAIAVADCAWAGEEKAEPQVRLEIDLVDGSRIVGTPSIESVPVQTSYAKMDVPLKEIRTIRIDADHETASLDLRNGDKLKGVVSLGPIELETVFGKVPIGIEHIRKLDVVLLGIAMASGVRLPSPLKWEKASLPWPDRIPAACVVFDGKIWLIGSAQDGEAGVFFNDVWCSADGDRWVKATSAAPWEPRAGAVALAYDGKLWLMGGCKAHSVMLGDIWSSRNGADWTPVSDNAPWGPRYCAGGVVKDDSMWIIGGSRGNKLCADVWRTQDGKKWALVADHAPWGPRAGSVAVFQDRLWVVAGRQGKVFDPVRNDVWSSANGREWECATKLAPWAPRQGAAVADCGGRLWLMGGETAGMAWVNDIWWTEDGVTWRQETEHADWPPQSSGRGIFEFDGSLWIAGGNNGYRQYVKGLWRTAGEDSRRK